MKILVVSAHPDPASLTNALRGVAVGQLEADGHEVRVTDLYAEDWKSAVDRADFPTLPDAARLRVPAASSAAFTTGTLTADVTTEQAKLLWADALILAFPLWWFSMPAILKGWIDRVYAYGFAYGVGEHSETRWGDRYGEGTLAGKRAMLVVTAGGWETHYGPRGINGPIDDLLFPIQHGVLFYPGYAVLPPFVVFQTFGVLKPPYVTYTVLALVGSTRTRVRNRPGSVPVPDAAHAGVAAVPLVVLNSCPLL